MPSALTLGKGTTRQEAIDAVTAQWTRAAARRQGPELESIGTLTDWSLPLHPERPGEERCITALGSASSVYLTTTAPPSLLENALGTPQTHHTASTPTEFDQLFTAWVTSLQLMWSCRYAPRPSELSHHLQSSSSGAAVAPAVPSPAVSLASLTEVLFRSAAAVVAPPPESYHHFFATAPATGPTGQGVHNSNNNANDDKPAGRRRFHARLSSKGQACEASLRAGTAVDAAVSAWRQHAVQRVAEAVAQRSSGLPTDPAVVAACDRAVASTSTQLDALSARYASRVSTTLASLADLAHRLVEGLGHEFDRAADLCLRGAERDVDRVILSRLEAVRNRVANGRSDSDELRQEAEFDVAMADATLFDPLAAWDADDDTVVPGGWLSDVREGLSSLVDRFIGRDQQDAVRRDQLDDIASTPVASVDGSATAEGTASSQGPRFISSCAAVAWNTTAELWALSQRLVEACEVHVKRAATDVDLRIHRAVAARTAALQNAKRESDDEVEALQNQLAHLVRRLRGVEGTLIEIDDERGSLYAAVEARALLLKTQRMDHHLELARRDAAFEAAAASVDRMTAIAATMQQRQLDMTAAHAANLARLRAAFSDENASLKETNARLHARVAELERANAQLSATVRELRDQMAPLLLQQQQHRQQQQHLASFVAGTAPQPRMTSPPPQGLSADDFTLTAASLEGFALGRGRSTTPGVLSPHSPPRPPSSASSPRPHSVNGGGGSTSRFQQQADAPSPTRALAMTPQPVLIARKERSRSLTHQASIAAARSVQHRIARSTQSGIDMSTPASFRATVLHTPTTKRGVGA